MSKVIIGEESEFRASCTALMVGAYFYIVGENGHRAPAPPHGQAKDIAAWFFCKAVYHLRVSHAIPQNVRINLAAPQSDGVSPILRWAADQMPDLARAQYGLEGILEWIDTHYHEPTAACWRDLLRESLIVGGQARFDDPPRPTLPAVCQRIGGVVRDRAEFELIDGQPEYMSTGGKGERLLVKGEWYPAERAFAWSRAPISTILFYVPGGRAEWLRIGLIFDRAPRHERRMRILFNYNCLWSGTIGDASFDELILACTGKCIACDSPNLLQVEVEEAFVPAEHSASSDNRRLGIGLRRLWVQRAEGLA